MRLPRFYITHVKSLQMMALQIFGRVAADVPLNGRRLANFSQPANEEPDELAKKREITIMKE